MAEKYKVGLLPFLNALPLVYRLQTRDSVEPVWGMPSELFHLMQAGKLDAALTSSFVYAAKLRTRITDLGVAAEGRVLTVMLYSQDPLDMVEVIEEDPASLTSNALMRIIFHERRQHVKFIPCPNLRGRLAPRTGRIVIGDHNFQPPFTYHHAYDVAALFHSIFKLPVVFALWQGGDSTPQPLVELLERAYAEVEADWEGTYKYAVREWAITHQAVEEYFGTILHFRLTPRDQDFLELFGRKVHELKLVNLGQ